MARNRYRIAWGLVLAASAACGGLSLFVGRINNAFYEPTGTIFGWEDAATALPELASRPKTRFVAVGVYAYFDPAQDQASAMSGSARNDLVQEIDQNDWLALAFADNNDLQPGREFKSALLRTTDDPFFRVADPTVTDATAGFDARVGFRRTAIRPNSPWDCPAGVPPFVCQPYRPFGSRATVTVKVVNANRSTGGNVQLSVTVKVEKGDRDPSDAITGQVNGNITATVVSERVAEANMDTLSLYALTNLDR